MDSLERTLAEIRSKAAELRNSFGDEERARAIEWAASLVERALQEHAEERLTLAEASARSGYSQDHLARLIREGSLPQGRRRGGRLEGHRDVAHLLSATGCRYVVGSDERAEEDARCRARIRLMRPPRPPDPGQVVGKTAPQTAPPLIEAQSTAGAIANCASR